MNKKKKIDNIKMLHGMHVTIFSSLFEIFLFLHTTNSVIYLYGQNCTYV